MYIYKRNTSFRYHCIFDCLWLFELKLKSTFYSFWILCKFFPHFYWSNKYNKWILKGRINKMSYNFNTLQGNLYKRRRTLLCIIFNWSVNAVHRFLLFLYSYVSVHVRFQWKLNYVTIIRGHILLNKECG